MAILKSVMVKKRAIIDYQFRSSYDGVIGCIFKFKDINNYYTFEVGGGDDMSKRFLQLRKKVDGNFNLIKKYNSNEDISSLPFFGYERNAWVMVEITIKYDEINIVMALSGTTTYNLVFKENDKDLTYGKVGWSTNGTDGAFSEILIRPIPIPYSK